MRYMASKMVLVLIMTLLVTTIAFTSEDGPRRLSSAANRTVDTSKFKSYVVVMEQSPIIAYEGEISGLPATKPGKGNKINPNRRAQQFKMVKQKGDNPRRLSFPIYSSASMEADASPYSSK